MAWRSQCKNGFFLSKSKASSNKCKDCQRKSKQKKSSKLRAAKRLLEKKRMREITQKI